MKPVTVRERKNIWQRVDAINVESGYVYTEDGFTVAEYAERYKLSIKGAGERLVKLTRSGKLSASWTLRNGCRTRLYTIADDSQR